LTALLWCAVVAVAEAVCHVLGWIVDLAIGDFGDGSDGLVGSSYAAVAVEYDGGDVVVVVVAVVEDSSRFQACQERYEIGGR
jgi:hypothetical protein